MQTALSRILTQISEPILYDNNYYTMSPSYVS